MKKYNWEVTFDNGDTYGFVECPSFYESCGSIAQEVYDKDFIKHIEPLDGNTRHVDTLKFVGDPWSSAPVWAHFYMWNKSGVFYWYSNAPVRHGENYHTNMNNRKLEDKRFSRVSFTDKEWEEMNPVKRPEEKGTEKSKLLGKILDIENRVDAADGIEYDSYEYTVLKKVTFSTRSEAAEYAASCQSAEIRVRGVDGIKITGVKA